MTRKLANGISVTPSAALQTEDIDSAARSSVTRSDAGITFSIPLARGLGRAANEADLRASTLGLEARREQTKQDIADRVTRTVAAYWRVRAESMRLKVALEAEAAASRLMERMRALISAGEGEKTRLDEASADFFRRQSDRLGVELNVVEARQDLGVAIGLAPDELANAPLAADEFAPVTPIEWSLADERALVLLALAQRGDLGAAHLNEQVQAAYVRRALNNLRPQADLMFRSAVSGAADGTNNDSMSDAIGGGLDGYNVSVGLSVDWPMENRAARGEYRKRKAGVREAEAGTHELRNTVAASVTVAAQALRTLAKQNAIAAATSAALGRVVDAQRAKVASGEAGLTALVQNQDRYFDARFAEIQNARAYFTALVQLRRVTGTLVELRADSYTLATEALAAPPKLPLIQQ